MTFSPFSSFQNFDEELLYSCSNAVMIFGYFLFFTVLVPVPSIYFLTLKILIKSVVSLLPGRYLDLLILLMYFLIYIPLSQFNSLDVIVCLSEY